MVEELQKYGIGQVGQFNLTSFTGCEIKKCDPDLFLFAHEKASSRFLMSLKQKTGPSAQT